MATLLGIIARPPIAILAIGYVLAGLVATELLVGYRRVRVKGLPFRRVHVGIAAALAGIMTVHALIGITHAVLAFSGTLGAVAGHVHLYLPASPDNLPMWLGVNGAAIVALFVVQALSGLGKFKLTRPQFLGLHSSVAWMLVGFATLHVVLATVHLLTG
jgi:hypothetical protein